MKTFSIYLKMVFILLFSSNLFAQHFCAQVCASGPNAGQFCSSNADCNPVTNNAPLFDDADKIAYITVDEGSGVENILSYLSVTDSDGGDTLTWTQVTSPSKGTFSVSGTSGGGSNKTPVSATYTPTINTIGSDTFSVRVSDTKATDDLSVNVTITDINPDLTDGQSFSIAENSANNTSVGTVVWTGDTDGLTFSIVSGNSTGAFKINSSTGEIQVNDTNQLDYETTTSYSLVISVDDEDADSSNDDTTTVTINVNDIDELAPTVSSIRAPSNGTYKATQNLSFTVNTSENVTVTGTPRLVLDIGGTTKHATYVSGSGGQALAFTYTVESGLNDTNGISVISLELNSGTLKDGAGNNMDLTLNSVGSLSNVLVDSIVPTLSSVTMASNNSDTSVAKVGDVITVSFTSSESLSGTPTATIAGNGAVVTNTSGNNYTATYTMQSGDSTGNIVFTIDFSDNAGNNGTQVTGVTSGSVVSFDKSAPTKSSSNPADGATGVSVNSNLTITFSENVALGSGNIILKKSDDNSVIETFNAATGNGDAGGTISVATNTLTINPNSDLVYNKAYYLQIASTAIVDGSGNSYTGINDTGTWNFTSAEPTVTLSASSSTIVENGGTSTLTATLSGVSGEDVTVNLSKSGTATDNTDYTLSSTSIVINAGSTTGTATLTGVDDLVTDAAETIIIDIDSVTGGSESGSQQETITITDDDSPGINLSKTTASVSESGSTDTFTVKLNTLPTGNVVIDLSSDDTGEATVSPATLTFTTANWNTPQTVTITGVDDTTVDGDQTPTVTLAINTGATADADYDALGDKTVTVTTTDNDTPGFTLSKTTASVNESGTTDTFTVVLDAQPASNVVIEVTSSDTSEATVSPANLIFSNGNWNIPQLVTLTGLDDSDTDGDVNSIITLSINDGSSDDSFDLLADQILSVITIDNDNIAPVISDISLITQEDTEVKLTLSNFTGAFSDLDTGDSLDKIRFTTLGTKGIIQLNGVNITVNQEISSSDINSLVYIPNLNISGTDTFTYEAKDSMSYSNGASLKFTITSVNDQPEIIRNFGSIDIDEDDPIERYSFSISDIEGEDINVFISSSNPNILSLISNWENPLTNSEYTKSLSFDLKPVANENGSATIKIRAIDTNGASNTESFSVQIASSNDTFNLERVSKQIYYKGFSKREIPLLTSNVDVYENLTYNVTLSNPDIINYSIEDNKMIITSPPKVISGKTTINISATDGEFSDAISFDLQVLLIEQDENIKEEGVLVVKEEDGIVITTISFEDGLTVKTEEDREKTTTISSGDTTSKAVSTLSDAEVKILENILHLTVEDLSLGVKADADVHTTGEVIHSFTYSDGKVTRAKSEAVGATTEIGRDNGLLNVTTTLAFEDTDIEVKANENGRAIHTVKFAGQVSQATSNITGTRTVINSNGAVTTTSGEVDSEEEYYIKAQVITKASGETTTRFVRVKKSNDEIVEFIGNTIRETTPYPLGNEVTVEMIDDKLQIKTKTQLISDIIIE